MLCVIRVKLKSWESRELPAEGTTGSGRRNPATSVLITREPCVGDWRGRLPPHREVLPSGAHYCSENGFNFVIILHPLILLRIQFSRFQTRVNLRFGPEGQGTLLLPSSPCTAGRGVASQTWGGGVTFPQRGGITKGLLTFAPFFF